MCHHRYATQIINTNLALTNCLEVGVRFASETMTYRKDLDLVASSGIKVLEDDV